ncbi:MAG TPA: M20/M25/M40 family metallo-hydrolase [Bacteroidia bacterium]
MKLLYTVLFAFVFSNFSVAQDTVYTRSVINKLCSPAFKGRAYVGKGDKKAASYIAAEFKSIGLKPLDKSFFQKFYFSVNTFPGKMSVKYNGNLLKPGIDYIVDPSATSIKFKGRVEFVPIEKLNRQDLYDTEFYPLNEVIIDTFDKKNAEGAAINYQKFMSDRNKKLLIRLSNEKLTWSSSYRQSHQCQIVFLSTVFDRTKPADLEINIEADFKQKYESNNVVALIEGTKYKDSYIVVTAHYDHLGMMGSKTMFPGANDNATGIAMILNMAKHYKANPSKYSIVFIAFSAEETGLIGSKYFVTNPLINLNEIKFLINIDLMGNGADGVMAVNGAVYKSQFEKLKSINQQKNYLPDVKMRGKAANSDHYWFSENGVPCFFFYLMGPYPYYHDVNDKASAVPLTNFSQAFQLFVDFIDQL